MGFGTGNTLPQGHIITYVVTPVFSTATKTFVFWVVLRSPCVSPIFFAMNDTRYVLYNISPILLALPLTKVYLYTCAIVVLGAEVTLRGHGSRARLSPRSMAPLPNMMNSGLINPSWRIYIE